MPDLCQPQAVLSASCSFSSITGLLQWVILLPVALKWPR